MKNFVRVICLLLACLFCLLTVVACNRDGDSGRKKTDVNIRVDEQGVRWAEDEWGTWRQYDDLPDEELDYDDEPISFLYWTGKSTVKAEFAQTEEVDNDRLSSIYKRNEAIMDRLGVELVFTPEPGDSGDMNNFVARVQRAKESETHDFDLIGAYSRSQGAMLTAGLVQNITAIEKSYIDTTKPWWPSNLSGNLAIKGNLYYVSGDISTNAIDQMHCIYFNKKLLNNNYQQEAAEYFASNPHVKTAETASKENPEGGNTASNMLYEMAYDGKWSLDDLLELSAGTYIDTRGDGRTSDDTFGLCSIYYCVTALYGASNLRMIESTTDGTILKISDDWTSSKTVKLVEQLKSIMSTNDYHTSGTTNAGSYFTPFNNGKCYFALYYMRMAEDFLLNNDKVDSYGILPCPKYDDNQRNYYTVIGNEFSIYSIFVDFDTRGNEQETLTMLSAVIECWASEAYRKTTPVIFELNMKLKSSPTQCEADMCEIVRKSIEFDMGRIFGTQLSGEVDETVQMDGMMARAAEYGTSWTTVTSDKIDSMRTNLQDFVTTLQKTLV